MPSLHLTLRRRSGLRSSMPSSRCSLATITRRSSGGDRLLTLDKAAHFLDDEPFRKAFEAIRGLHQYDSYSRRIQSHGGSTRWPGRRIQLLPKRAISWSAEFSKATCRGSWRPCWVMPCAIGPFGSTSASRVSQPRSRARRTIRRTQDPGLRQQGL